DPLRRRPHALLHAPHRGHRGRADLRYHRVAGVVAVPSAPHTRARMKLSLCNEVLRPLPLAAQCEAAARMGYAALEIAPFTLADDPGTLSTADARQWRHTAHAR